MEEATTIPMFRCDLFFPPYQTVTHGIENLYYVDVDGFLCKGLGDVLFSFGSIKIKKMLVCTDCDSKDYFLYCISEPENYMSCVFMFDLQKKNLVKRRKVAPDYMEAIVLDKYKFVLFYSTRMIFIDYNVSENYEWVEHYPNRNDQMFVSCGPFVRVDKKYTRCGNLESFECCGYSFLVALSNGIGSIVLGLWSDPDNSLLNRYVAAFVPQRFIGKMDVEDNEHGLDLFVQAGKSLYCYKRSSSSRHYSNDEFELVGVDPNFIYSREEFDDFHHNQFKPT